ncbi:discoidin domain-containing protein [Catenuloplanes indicus]|uniref:F5/8 type C domain-containing protein n=1 Tax=Catenuloplanes indicus TaxID=137267 RepID=A0AAE3VVR4_9ACTN|nr:exo-alpha-sialidase [Catenuloplanes indicus]MDQ0363865.1 hypothetical protein [Catenuloplanes indicus]
MTVTTVTVAGFGAAPARAAVRNDPACGVAVNGTPPGGAGQDPAGYVLNVGGASEFGTVWDPPGDDAPGSTPVQAAFPGVLAVDAVATDGTPVRRQYARFGLTRDDPNITGLSAQLESVDDGATFPAATYLDDPARAVQTSAIRLRDGSLLAYSFKTQPPPYNVGRHVRLTAYRSTDEGRTWASEDVLVDMGVYFHGGRTASVPLELPNGDIVFAVYGKYADSANYRVQLQASTDGGRTFTRRGILAPADAANSYNETGLAALPNGKLIAVVRHHVPNSAGSLDDVGVPVWTTSADNGATWTPLRDLSVTFPYGYDPMDDTTKKLEAVAPDLKLMPNGALVLRAGRPDNWVAISTDGQGTGWIGQLTYRNCPTDGDRHRGSTGYGGIDYVSANRAVVVGDNCDVTWSCTATSGSRFTVDKQTRVWRRWIDVLTPDVGRIDLATKYRKGKITVSGNMTSSVPGHPRARVDGAFDGSTEYWSSAVNTGGAGTYVLHLDRSYPLTKIGLSLRNGRTATGRVHLSSDGVTWGQPVAVAADRTHLAMEFFTLPTPAEARFVKIEVDASSACAPHLTGSCSFLNELELYSSINSFENDPVNNRPRGFTDIVQSWQTQRDPALADNDSASALVIVDTNANHIARVDRPGTPSPTRTLEFRLKPLHLLGFLVDLHGRDAAGKDVTAYHLAVTADGRIARHDGNAWINLTGPGVVTENNWSTLRVTADTMRASIQVGGVTVAPDVPASTRAATLTGYGLASNGTATVGDKYLVDDVLFTP